MVDFIFCVGYFWLLRKYVVLTEKFAFSSIMDLNKSFPPSSRRPIEALFATAVTMLSIDFASYVVHRLLHKVPILWKIHRVHHSATSLTPLTTYRQHPLEPLILYGARGLAAGIGLSVFYLFFPHRTPVITVAGLGAGFFIYMFTVNLHHAPVPVRYPRRLRRWLISPHIHHLHHSANPIHYGRNFGVVFAIWDRLFHTYRDVEFEPGTLQFGLSDAL